MNITPSEVRVGGCLNFFELRVEKMLISLHYANSQKMHFRYFLAVFELLSDSLTAIYSVIHISIPPSKEPCSKMATGEVDMSLP